MAKASEVSRVRKVLDFVPSHDMARWPGRRYLDALNRRLNREVVVETTIVQPGRDEAVLVVAPEDWDALHAARQSASAQEAELDRTRAELEAVQRRHDDLEHEVARLRARLSGLKIEDEKRKVALQLVGVRRAPPPAPEQPPTLAEPGQLEALGWQVVGDDEKAEWEDVPAVDAQPQETAIDTEGAIRQVESEIIRIENELEALAHRESTLRRSGKARPGFARRGYTLYSKQVGEGDARRPLYFFSKSTPEGAQRMAAVPEGYTVGVNRRSGLPFLKKVAQRKPRKAPRKAVRNSKK